MAAAKVRLMKISGDLEQLNPLSAKLLSCGCFYPDAVGKYVSSTMGFLPHTQDEPYSEKLEQLQTAAKTLGLTLEKTGEPEAEGTWSADDEAALTALHKQASDYTDEKEALHGQKEVCEAGLQKYDHFKNLDLPLDSLADCAFVKARFGHLPKESLPKFQTVFDDDPFLQFYPCSEDKTDYWGVYLAPADRVNEIDGKFAFLMFDPVSVPGAAGTVAQVMEQVHKSMSILDEQLASLEKERTDYCSKEQARTNAVYTKLLFLRDAFRLRAHAWHSDRSFMLVGFVPQEKEDELETMILTLPDVTVERGDKRISARKAVKMTGRRKNGD